MKLKLEEEIALSLFLIFIFIKTGIFLFLCIAILFIAICLYAYHSEESQDKKDKDKDKSASWQEEDFLELCMKFIIYSARYCRCTKIETETITKTEEFINIIDSLYYDYRVQELNKIITDSDIDVAYSYVNFLGKEISSHKRTMSLAEEKLFLDALFSAIYCKQNYIIIINLLNGLSIVSEGSLSKAKSRYEYIYRNNYSGEANSYEQKQKEKQKQKRKEKQKQKQKEKEEEDEAMNNQKIFDLTLELLVEAMKVDRSKKVCELDVIKEYILENDKEHFQERVAEVKEYLSYEYIELNVENACTKITKILRKDYIKRENILQILMELIYADETCTNAEFNFLNKVAKKLNVSKSSFDYIRARYENRKNKRGQSKSNKDKSKQDYSGSYSEQQNYREQQSDSQNNNSQDNNSQDNNSQNNNSRGNSQNSQSESQPTYKSELEKAYAALGISQDATDRELSACWRNLMRVNHPDLMESRGPEAVRKATERCQEINKAFEIVKASRGMK